MAFLNLKGDYGVEILSYYLWGQSTPPSNLSSRSLVPKGKCVLIDKNYKARDENTEITIEASAPEYMGYVDRYTNAASFGVFNKFFNHSFSEKELQEFKHKIENGICTLELKEMAKILYKDEKKFDDEKDENKFTNEDNKANKEKTNKKRTLGVSHYTLDINSNDYAKRAFTFGSTGIEFNEDVKFLINAKTYEPICVFNLRLYPADDNFDFESDDSKASSINPFLENNLDPLKIGRKVNIKFIDVDKIRPQRIYKRVFEVLKTQSKAYKASLLPSYKSFIKYYNDNILSSGVLYSQDSSPNFQDFLKHLNSQKTQDSPKENSSSNNPPSFITLILKDEHNKPIANTKVCIKGFNHKEALRTITLPQKSNTQGKIRFDKEKYFSDCLSFKVKLIEQNAFASTPIQNAKRIFRTYTHHREGLVLKFKAKDYLSYDGFNLYHFKGNTLIASYMARSGTAKENNTKTSDKQIATCFYSNDTNEGKKAYFYYDDESIAEQFGSIPEGEYYLKINSIHQEETDMLSKEKNYPFELGKTWGKYNVCLYTNKECSNKNKNFTYTDENNQSKEIKKEDLYLYTLNAKSEFGSKGSIGIKESTLFEYFCLKSKYIQDEEEGVVCLEVRYAKEDKREIIFVGELYE